MRAFLQFLSCIILRLLAGST